MDSLHTRRITLRFAHNYYPMVTKITTQRQSVNLIQSLSCLTGSSQCAAIQPEGSKKKKKKKPPHGGWLNNAFSLEARFSQIKGLVTKVVAARSEGEERNLNSYLVASTHQLTPEISAGNPQFSSSSLLHTRGSRKGISCKIILIPNHSIKRPSALQSCHLMRLDVHSAILV